VVESAEAFADKFDQAPDSRLGPAVLAFFRNGGRRCWVIPAEPPFLDDRLAPFGITTLLREAAALDDAPRGVHAVLAIEEVTLLAVPDAFPPRAAPILSGTDSAPGPPGGGGTPTAGAVPTFGACKVPDPAVLELTLTLKSLPDPMPPHPSRKWQVASWGWKTNSAGDEKAEEDRARAGARFTLERSESGSFSPGETETVYRGTGFAVSVGPEPAGYRVRAETATLTGAWSSLPVTVTTAQPVPGKEDPVATQIAAVQVCAARGDVLAVLTPPEDWSTGSTNWVAGLQPDGPPNPGGRVLPWTEEDSRALRTHAAFWGPWVLTRDVAARSDAEPDAFPADGAVCGLLARRALETGPWASILNLPLAGALGLGPAPYGPGEFVPLFAAEPSSDAEGRKRATADQKSGVNRLARTARGFVPVGERTAWPDAKADPVNGLVPEAVPVRRFMALLRREVTRLGVDLAFAPNGAALERRATRAVEAVLERLLRGGALAGPDARSSYQVTARAGDPDTDNAGRLEIEVRVRSALPLRLLTIRLIRSDEGAFTIAEGRI
jgi:hypothetical protein